MTERLVDVDTPLGDKLWFRQMTGTEALSTLFEFDVTFHSKTVGLKAKDMLGCMVKLKIETQDKGVRHLNGMCTRFATGGREGDHQVYTAKLRPSLWLASRRSDCKIFQNLTVPNIIKSVLEGAGNYDFPVADKLQKTYRQWEFCVQYQETDLNFVMRLMEHEGIFFYFDHNADAHTLTLVDENFSLPDMPERETIEYSGVDATSVHREEHFDSWHLREEMDPGDYCARDYDFKQPDFDLETKRAHHMGHAKDGKERYEWPGGYVAVGDGEQYARVRMEELVAEHERAQGHCTLRTMAPGHTFTLEKCPQADQNRRYVAVAATYFFRDNARRTGGSGDGDAAWGITVTSQPMSITYRPQRVTPKPRTHGPQTALVVGPPGEEIYVDKYGRVALHFYWDRHDRKNQDSSCWIRVSQPWAGDKWGFIHIPRIGQEVIVDFIGGDPDYPVITGRVYNEKNMPPYALPDNKTQSGIKSRSSKGGGPDHFNEIRMEDKMGSEQLYIHAQKDLETRVEHDEKRTVDNDRVSEIKNDDTRTVTREDKHTIGQKQTWKVGTERDTTIGASDTVKVAMSQKTTAGQSIEQTAGMEMKLKASATMDLMAGGQMSMKAPSIDATAGSVMVKGGSIMVQGASVTIQAGSILLQGAVVITGPLTVAGPIVGLVVTGTTTTTALANIV